MLFEDKYKSILRCIVDPNPSFPRLKMVKQNLFNMGHLYDAQQILKDRLQDIERNCSSIRDSKIFENTILTVFIIKIILDELDGTNI